MDTQELYQKVADHLLSMKEPSKMDGDCAYRGDNGSMCAVGCLIKDEHYNKDLEGSILYKDQAKLAVEKSIGRRLKRKEMATLQKLQNLHDNFNNWSKEGGLKEPAKDELQEILSHELKNTK